LGRDLRLGQGSLHFGHVLRTIITARSDLLRRCCKKSPLSRRCRRVADEGAENLVEKAHGAAGAGPLAIRFVRALPGWAATLVIPQPPRSLRRCIVGWRTLTGCRPRRACTPSRTGDRPEQIAPALTEVLWPQLISYTACIIVLSTRLMETRAILVTGLCVIAIGCFFDLPITSDWIEPRARSLHRVHAGDHI
jgi:hypothetical protein